MTGAVITLTALFSGMVAALPAAVVAAITTGGPMILAAVGGIIVAISAAFALGGQRIAAMLRGLLNIQGPVTNAQVYREGAGGFAARAANLQHPGYVGGTSISAPRSGWRFGNRGTDFYRGHAPVINGGVHITVKDSGNPQQTAHAVLHAFSNAAQNPTAGYSRNYSTNMMHGYSR